MPVGGPATHGLWNLWDMLDRLFGTFYYQLKLLEVQTELVTNAITAPGILAPDFAQKTVKEGLIELRQNCKDFLLPESVKHIDRVLKNIALKTDYNYLSIQLQDIHDGIRDEARDHAILIIAPERSKLLYEKPKPWDPVSKAFNRTDEDIFGAIACYMYDQNTASVFHSMRILETGLKALAEALNVPFGTEVWHIVLDQIEAKIRELERSWPKGQSKTDFLKFYSNAAKEFRYFKDGWRNYVSHNLHRYDAPQALSTLMHVRDFMIELSSRLSEIWP